MKGASRGTRPFLLGRSCFVYKKSEAFTTAVALFSQAATVPPPTYFTTRVGDLSTRVGDLSQPCGHMYRRHHINNTWHHISNTSRHDGAGASWIENTQARFKTPPMYQRIHLPRNTRENAE